MLSYSSSSPPSSSKSVAANKDALLAPGFRFHPTDEEIVSYYLKRKICGIPLRFDSISEIDIYRFEPWDLPSKSRLKTRDLEWYFFSSLDKKHGNGSRTNRATEKGYWKTTGKDRPVRRYSRTVGMKKTLVFHLGRAPHGERSNWVMHEYRLEDPELGQVGSTQGTYVLCRIFQKSGPGPKNGEQYGAPFIEEEWDDDAVIPKKENSGNDNIDIVSDVGEWGYVQMNDDEQNLDTSIRYDNAVPVLGFHGCDGDNNLKDRVGFPEGIDDKKILNDPGADDNFPEVYVDEFFDDMGENTNFIQEQADQYFCSVDENTNLTESDEMCPLVKDENNEESNNFNAPGADILTGETADDGMMYFDAPTHNQLPIEDDFLIEIDDLLNRDDAADASGFEMLDELLTYFDATNDNLHHVPPVSSSNLSECVDFNTNLVVPASEVSAGTVQASVECPQTLKAPEVGQSSSSLQNPQAAGSRDNSRDDLAANDTVGSDVPYDATWDKSLAKHFTSMLESITAPPAFAVDYATGGSAKSVRHNSAQSTSVHVNAGMFLVSQLRVTDEEKHWLSQKTGDQFTSFGMGGDVMATKHLNGYSSVLEVIAETPARAISVTWQAGFYFGFLWVLVLGVSFKISNFICTR
ncbi:hypothetical protein AAC387_Pa09g0548 [Persea americana]